ncbi:hypothetical protein CRG98_048757, partial [Punica granatum]
MAHFHNNPLTASTRVGFFTLGPFPRALRASIAGPVN